jgi:uncharacterized protein DUF4760
VGSYSAYTKPNQGSSAELARRSPGLSSNPSSNYWEFYRCIAKSFTHSALVSAVYAATVSVAYAQSTSGPAQRPGLSFEYARELASPIADAVAYVFVAVASVWNYLMDNPAAAGLLAAALATAAAYFTIQNHREMTRLRETFAMMDRLNWDKDHIDARRVFADIREGLKANNESVAKYVEPRQDDREKMATLIAIMSNYENLALGVRRHIIDETYLHRYVRGMLICDWEYLAPFVTVARTKHTNQALYIEFEGMAIAWKNNKSYRTGNKLKRSRLTIKVE